MATALLRYMPTNKCIDIIKANEGLYLHAYQDKLGGGKLDVPTIGYGTIEYPDGTLVKMGDTCTELQAATWLLHEATEKAKEITKILAAHNQFGFNTNQLDAIVSFTYNEGLDNLKGSTLLRKALINPNDTTISHYTRDAKGKPVIRSCEFLKWVYSQGQMLNGLFMRRATEADLYNTKHL